MREERNLLILDNYEQNIMLNALHELRCRLKSEDRPTDVLDELILKTANTSRKKIRFSDMGHDTR